MSRSADRNLLFGLLALQLSFIDRDALVDAFHRWVSDRSKPLDQILQDRGALRPDEHDLLQALVAKHLEKFGGDPEKSLAALSSIGSLRQDLSQIAGAPSVRPNREAMPIGIGWSRSSRTPIDRGI